MPTQGLEVQGFGNSEVQKVQRSRRFGLEKRPVVTEVAILISVLQNLHAKNLNTKMIIIIKWAFLCVTKAQGVLI